MFNLVGVAFLLLGVGPAGANMIIVPTYDTTINNDPNATIIKSTIQTAINFYEFTFADNITVNITFQEGGGLGGSSFNLFTVSYAAFHAALMADATSADDATALARLAADGSGATNPVTGSSVVVIKAPNAKALGFNVPQASDGTITLNTSLTTPGSSSSSSQYSLLAVAEHEIDEILGLGSTLGLALAAPLNNDPSPEDFFRFTAGNVRSFSLPSNNNVFFSLDGATNLVGFNNPGCDHCSDYGDWATSTTKRVQDAISTPGVFPAMGVEVVALDVIGYDLAVPEPSTGVMVLGGLLLASGLKKAYKSFVEFLS